MGLEPMTSSLPRKCSTTELQQQFPLRLSALNSARRSAELGVHATLGAVKSQRASKLGGLALTPSTANQTRRAGEGNRTLVFSLEGCCSTIELHPLVLPCSKNLSISESGSKSILTVGTINTDIAHFRQPYLIHHTRKLTKTTHAQTKLNRESGRCRIRTYVDISQRIYSPSPLTTRATSLF